VQCTVALCGDNAIRVYSGTTAGTLLGTLTSAFVATVWDSYQGKIVINNTTGSVEIRKNGSVSPIINLSSVNTRAGSANNYANQCAISSSASISLDIDDFWLNSDNGAAPTSWPGDVRCLTQMAASDSSIAFSPSPNPVVVTTSALSTSTKGANTFHGRLVTATASGTIATATVGVAVGGTGNLKAAIYDSTHTTVLGTSNGVVNPGSGNVALTFAVPVAVVRGQSYWIFADQDFSITYNVDTTGSTSATGTTTYASFPAPSPAVATGISAATFTVNITPTNSSLVADPTQDGDTSYVYSSTVAQEDKYGIAAMGVVPASMIGVAPFVFWKKSDSGARTGTISVTANGSADTGQIIGVTPSLSYTYNQKFMPLDPTGAGWTAANVNAMLLGVTVAS
jgi:hypothetical protein